jgi:hypothetical protein
MSTNSVECMTPAALHRLRVHEFAALFPPLQGDDRDRLRDSMKRGYDPLHPIVTTPDGQIVDGRNRRDLAVELGLVAPVLRREFADDAEVAAFVVAENLARRHLDQRQRRELAGKLVLNGTSSREAGKAAGVSHATAQRAAEEARAGGTNVPPGADRVTGRDGKSHPAKRPRSPSNPPGRARRHVEKPARPDHEPGYVDSQALELLEHTDRTMNADNIENQLAWDVGEAIKAKDEVWLSRARASIAALITRLEHLQRVLDDPVDRQRARDEINETKHRPHLRVVGKGAPAKGAPAKGAPVA